MRTQLGLERYYFGRNIQKGYYLSTFPVFEKVNREIWLNKQQKLDNCAS